MKSKKLKLVVVLVMFCMMFLIALPLYAAESFPAPRQASSSGEGLLTQQWTINASGSDGSSLRVVFELANFSEKERLNEMMGQSLKSTAAFASAEYTSADGKRKNVEQAAGGDWSFSSEKQSLGIASNTLKREKSSFKLAFESDDMRIELDLKPLESSWKPAASKMLLGNPKSRYFDVIVFAPRAEVKGVVRLRELGQSVEKRFSGDAVLSYEYGNMRQVELMKRRVDIVYFDKKNTVIFGGLAQPSSGKAVSHSWFYVKKAGSPAITSVKNSVKFRKIIGGEHYDVPQVVEISAGSGSAAYKLDLANRNILRRNERLDQRENVHGFVARQFSKPVEYEIESAAELAGVGVASELKSFKAVCRILYLNK